MKVKRKTSLKKILECKGCDLCMHPTRRRSGPVIGKGSIPADMLIIGEAPSKEDDLLKEPFSGPEGELLIRMINESIKMSNSPELTCYYTNSVLCRPWIWDKEDELYGINRKPKDDEILACMSNVMEVYKQVKPSIIVFVGKVAEQFYKNEFSDFISLNHPSFHMKYGGKSSPYYRSDVRTLTDALRRINL